MARYIDADDVLTQKKPLKWQNSYEQGKVEGWNQAIDYIGNFAPTADVKPVVRGEWKRTPTGHPYCSVCGDFPWEHNSSTRDFCSECGADMRGENDVRIPD